MLKPAPPKENLDVQALRAREKLRQVAIVNDAFGELILRLAARIKRLDTGSRGYLRRLGDEHFAASLVGVDDASLVAEITRFQTLFDEITKADGMALDDIEARFRARNNPGAQRGARNRPVKNVVLDVRKRDR